MDKDMPADWAIERACRLADCRSIKEDIVRKHETHWGEGAVIALARYIEAHEQPPVDPDLVTAREICAKVADELARTTLAVQYRDSTFDESHEVQFALAKLKEARGI